MKTLIIIIFSVVLLFPIYWMITGSFQNIEGIIKDPPSLIPTTFTFKNYEILISERPIARWLANTLFISVFSTLMSLSVTVMSGYAFSRYKFKGQKIVFWLFMASIMVPGQVMFVPKFVLIRRLGLGGLRWSVILPHVFSPVHIYLFKNYVDTIPADLFETAKIEGANPIQMLRYVAIPLCKPIVGALALFLALGVMGDYMWQYLMLQEESKQTLLIGIMTTIFREVNAQLLKNPIGLSLAGSTILFAPMLSIFIFFQKYFQKGILRGAIKQ